MTDASQKMTKSWDMFPQLPASRARQQLETDPVELDREHFYNEDSGKEAETPLARGEKGGTV